MIENVIFDYNGVISNDFELVYQTAMQLLQKYGHETLPFAEFKDRFRLPAAVYWHEILPDANFDELNASFFEIYSSLGSPQPYPNAKATLESLADQGYKLVILSAHHQENLLRELATFGIDSRLFAAIYTDVKNKLEVIEHVLAENQMLPEQTAYIGDTEHDIETAHKAGLLAIASTFGYRTREQLATQQPDYFVDDISELTGVINP